MSHELLTISKALRAYKYRFTTELELHKGIAEALTKAGVTFNREVWIGNRDRIDFLCGAVGIEVKVKGSLADVGRQVNRYAVSDQIDALFLVTTKRLHRLPALINGKHVETVWIGFQGAF
jgi:hypothetical protein